MVRAAFQIEEMMSSMNSILDHGRKRKSTGSMRNSVVATHEYLGRLETALASSQRPGIQLRSLGGDEPVPLEIINAADVLVLEVDPSSERSLARLSQVRQIKPNMPVVAAIENADFNLTRLLVRQGVFDVVSLPFDPEELHSRIMDASATVATKSDAALAPMIAIASPVGGTGATTVITHLAAAISRDPTCARPCCIVDLDLQFGDVANYFGISPPVTVLELLEAGERLDGELVRNAAVDTGRGPVVLAAPPAIAPLELVDIDRLLQLLEIVRREFGFVLLDLPANWTNWTLSAVLACSDILLLTDQSLNGLRRTKRCLEMLKSVDVPNSAVNIVVNRFEKRFLQKIGAEEVGQAVDRDVRATLAREGAGLSQAQDQGLLLEQVSRKAKFTQDIATLAQDLCRSGGVR
jgi:pilus assembly protein CpaE